MKIDDIQPGDVLVFEYSEVLVLGVGRFNAATGRHDLPWYAVGNHRIYSFPPTADDIGITAEEVTGSFVHLRRNGKAL